MELVAMCAGGAGESGIVSVVGAVTVVGVVGATERVGVEDGVRVWFREMAAWKEPGVIEGLG
jgi:hypothetical protein